MRGRWIVILAGALTLLVGPAPAALGAEPLTLTAKLTGSAEVPPVSTGGTGRAVVVVNAERTQLSYRITYQGLSSPIQSAGICFTWSTTDVVCACIGGEGCIPAGPSPLAGTRTIDPAQVADMSVGHAWVGIVTAEYPQGEIRGQLLPGVPGTSTVADARGAHGDGGVLSSLLVGLIAAWAFLRLRHAPSRQPARSLP